jgi:hypothetical protein
VIIVRFSSQIFYCFERFPMTCSHHCWIIFGMIATKHHPNGKKGYSQTQRIYPDFFGHMLIPQL